MTPRQMFNTCYARTIERNRISRQPQKKRAPMFGYAETTREIILYKWNPSRGKSEYTEVILPVGTTVKAVMFSRFGDFGITDDLDAENGYHLRLFPTREEQVESSCQVLREGVLTAEECLTNFRVEEK